MIMETNLTASLSVLVGYNGTTVSFEVEEISTPVVFGPQVKSLDFVIPTTIFLGLMVLATIIGNVFVIAAILREKTLQNATNCFVTSDGGFNGCHLSDARQSPDRGL